MLAQGISNTKLEYEVKNDKPTTKSRYGLFRVETNYKYKNEVFTPKDEFSRDKIKDD